MIIKSAAYFRCDMSEVYFVRETAYRAKLVATNDFHQWNYLIGGFSFFFFFFSKIGYLAKDHFYYGVLKNPKATDSGF